MSKKRPGSLRSLVFLLCAEHFVFCLSGMLSSDDLLFLLEACPVLLVIRTCLDLSCAREGDSGKLRANQLIDQYAEQDDIADQAAHFITQRLRCYYHAERHARLREQGDSQILADCLTAVHKGAAETCTHIFTQAAHKNIHDTDQDNGRIAEYAQVQFRA